MIKKTLISFLILFSLYAIYRDVVRPDMLVSQEQWQDNQVRAQEFLYSDSISGNIIIVGSSMPMRLIMDSLPSYIINLSFGGESSIEGLELLKRRNYHPKCILIETNTLYKGSTGFDDILYNPILFTARKYLPVLRDGRQPLPLFKNYVESYIIQKLIPYQFPFAMKKENLKDNTKEQEPLNANEHQGNTAPITQLSERTLKKKSLLKNYIDYFEERGTKIILYEMPQEPSKLYLAENARKVTFDICPESKYPYILVDWTNYETSDGVHLTKESALKYTLFLRGKIEELIN